LRKPVFKYEGGRCEVCTTIKKGGCGTENAHRRCLKNPRGLQTVSEKHRVEITRLAWEKTALLQTASEM
jgi:hypothetical protein